MSMRGSGEDAYWVDATGAGWLTLPITLHSSRMPMCDLTPQQCAFELQYWLNWYEADHHYALPTVAFILAIVLFFTIGALGDLILPRAVQRWTVIRKVRASARFLAYKSFRIPFLRWYSPSLGIILIGALGFVFFMAMTLGKHPYYWPNTEETNYGSSPPVATRSGWMSLACLPFILILAAKENPISVLTRIAYEKLNVFHRWLSWAMYALALVHTFPFIVYHRKEGDMGMQWGMSAYYWTGVIAILAQSWLTFFSIGPIRNRFYEIFKATHLLAAAMFFAFLFIHVGFTLSSVDYMIAAAVLYFVCWVAASLRTAFEHGPKPVPARLEMLPHDVLKISVPTASSWKPGQHIFLRFLSWNVHSLTAHPFTISSLPKREGSSPPRNKNEMIFYVHPRGGYTGRLAALARQNPDCRVNVTLDGPYGGMKDRSLGLFDKAVIISGGAGAGFMLPVLEDLLRMKAAKEEIDVKIVFCTRKDEHATWFCEQIAALLDRYRATGVKVEVHVTGGVGANVVSHELEESNNDEADTGKEMIEEERKVGSDSEGEDFAILKRTGRPNTKAIVAQAADRFGGTLGIAACGPEDLLFEVRNAVADAQKNIGPDGPDDVYLYSEQFGW
ncbi:MAG: hypothetical protein M1821_004402 [Bathelium mastoideum]|nr:MAG: hypothetical protein M1821_004402 [Bathelium mastoideum]